MSNILNLTLKKKWFDLIKSGVKKEEYREVKDYWQNRLEKPRTAPFVIRFKDFDCIRFRNGYAKDAPTFDIELKGIEYGTGNPEWGAEKGKTYYVLSLGKILD
ncbi:ASCH domain-containing protein [Altibacter sp. HG106]|uniref:ASCH domain-containing protein n=1 Tax=Altibacter sp. HG106 TaxID=3023937 RepID=UPI002350A4E0|nr:ASCH domain-containing protein [Altibacter sp. HG106]MDC7994442.1 ASCH domain-containing protein [Altibacter sp. HG106]